MKPVGKAEDLLDTSYPLGRSRARQTVSGAGRLVPKLFRHLGRWLGRWCAAPLCALVAAGSWAPVLAASPAAPSAAVESYLADLLRPPYAIDAALRLVLPSSLPPGVSPTQLLPFLATPPLPQSATVGDRACAAAGAAAFTPFRKLAYERWAGSVSFRLLSIRQVGSVATARVAFSQPKLTPFPVTPAASAAVAQAVKALEHSPQGTALQRGMDHMKILCQAASPAFGFDELTGSTLSFGVLLAVAAEAKLELQQGHVQRSVAALSVTDTDSGWRVRLSGPALVPGLLLLDAHAFDAWLRRATAGSTAGSGTTPGTSGSASGPGAIAWAQPRIFKSSDGRQGLNSVSCVGVRFCLAVQAPADATVWNGRTWSPPRPLGPGNRSGHGVPVSCASPQFCVVLDGQYAYTWNGSVWSVGRLIDPPGGLNAASCVSASFCVAVDYAGAVLTWDGHRWSLPLVVDPNGSGLYAVSCVSAMFCVAVDYNGNALLWNGVQWSEPMPVASHAGTIGSVLTGVSCASRFFCVAVDQGGGVATWNGRAWSQPVKIDSSGFGLSAVSCPSPAFCVALDDAGNSYVWDDRTWSLSQPVASGMLGESVSCVGAGLCAAVGGTDAVVGRLRSRAAGAA